jgi:hypothetical protein
MRFVFRVIILFLLSHTAAHSQTFDQSSLASKLLFTPSGVLDLPDAPAPRAINGTNLPGSARTMPLTRSVSSAESPALPGPRQAFMIATRSSFNPSAYAVVGLTSLIAEAEDQHPALGQGAPSLWRYYWRGFLDRTDGNYWVMFALPAVLHEDEQFHAMQHGRKFYRLMYACSRVVVVHDDRGRKTINAAELLGRGASQAISLTYYPQSDRSAEAFGGKYGYSLLRDAATNLFREFRTDLETHVLHHRL